MKKVRYALGALGAVPALGLTAAPGNAAPAAAHPAHETGKKVSLTHVRAASGINIDVCSNQRSKHNQVGIFEGKVYYDDSGVPSKEYCFYETEGILSKAQTGLVMRTRIYSVNGHRDLSKFVGGSIIGNVTYFFDRVSIIDHQACEALVSAAHHSKLKYGDACQTA